METTPHLKRFINADSTDLLTIDCTNLMQYNLFMYCNGDPVNGVDPSGHEDIYSALFKFIYYNYEALIITDLINGEERVSAEAIGQYFSLNFWGVIEFTESAQIVVDSEGHLDAQVSMGSGYGTGAGLSFGTVEYVYPSLNSITDTRGFGANVGGSFSMEWVNIGGDIINAGEGDDLHPIGFGMHAGVGSGAEIHVDMNNTVGTMIR